MAVRPGTSATSKVGPNVASPPGGRYRFGRDAGHVHPVAAFRGLQGDALDPAVQPEHAEGAFPALFQSDNINLFID